MKKRILSIIFSVASGIVLVLQAIGVNTGNTTVDSVISAVMGVLMAAGIITDRKLKDKE